MLNINEFTSRLQMLLDRYHLTASAFADSINVQRSGISHILSGRNKPSLDFVMKITNVYKDVSLEWLLYGTEEFPKTENETSDTNETPYKEIDNTMGNDLFHSNENFSPKKSNSEIINNAPTTNLASNISKKEVEKIIIFYTDKTFDTYSPS
ncbi:transcriptional regulator [Neptunitalea chrysea]|uniref:Transcriptional regulator n=1 Tax=Neptunitalea chrysea TaxID=1647581 RepID=A0A9W6B514_9FLAO|nr:helix-turn-helix transcriptional regulator [Neptunitalea chrysea]GLB51992.1 transcriptional regulator [Neptunitalea chrysea]